jgi:tRNA modification GTPase
VEIASDVMTQGVERRAGTAALLTPVGRGAVATIRVEAESSQVDLSIDELFHAANGQALLQQPVGRIVFGRWGRDSTFDEDVVVCKRAIHHCEIHCHGGDAAVRRILEDLAQANFVTVPWQQQLSDFGGLLESECADQLSRATTWRTAEILQEQASGVLRDWLGKLLELAADLSSTEVALAQLDSMLAWSRFGLHLSSPWHVVLTGRPNVGKSSLINALLGYQRAIVFDQPGTTRDVVTAETAFDGWPVLLADTAGLRETSEELEAAGIAMARGQLETADARLVLVDLSQPPTGEDEQLISNWFDAIVIGHKCDLGDCWGTTLPATAIKASSVTGQGLDEIQQRLIKQVVPSIPAAGTTIPVNSRQVGLLGEARQALATGNRDAARDALMRLLVEPVADADRVRDTE